MIPGERLAWPNGARCAVILPFDFDAEAGWLSRNTTTADRPGILSQGTYGARVGVPRILNMLDRLQVRASFIPGWVAERHPHSTSAIRDAGHEIGHHGYPRERAVPTDPDGERRSSSESYAHSERSPASGRSATARRAGI